MPHASESWREAFNYLTARKYIALPAVLTLQNRSGLHVSPWKNFNQLLLYQQTPLPRTCHSTAASCTQLCSCSLNNTVLLATPAEHSEKCSAETWSSCEQARLENRSRKGHASAEVSLSQHIHLFCRSSFGCSTSFLAQSSMVRTGGIGSYSMQLKYWGK